MIKRIGLTHQPCTQSADDKPEHWTEHDEPDCQICDGRAVRLDCCLCLHSCSLGEPELIQDTGHDKRQSAPDKHDFFHAIMPDDRRVALDFRIAPEQSIPLLVNENAGADDEKQRNGEPDTQCRFTGRFDDVEEKSERVHVVLSCAEKLGFDPARSSLNAP